MYFDNDPYTCKLRQTFDSIGRKSHDHCVLNGLCGWWLLNTTFNNISEISALLVEETEIPGKKNPLTSS